MSLLLLMGSGETAPAMVKVHREIIQRTNASHPVFIDTPFGFQVNADDLTARTAKYFSESVGIEVSVARWRTKHAPAGERNATLALLSRADWLFCGPGSPTYALSQWEGTDVPAALADIIDRGGCLVLGSAAAVTAGSHALPVYEIYKVGTPPAWVEGLDLLERFAGLRVAAIPHFNNAEGGSYDTRYCYLGEARLVELEEQLPHDMSVLGVDEHTAVIMDLAAGTVEVQGTGVMTIRRQGTSRVFAAGAQLSLTELANLTIGRTTQTFDLPPTALDDATEPVAPNAPPSLGAIASDLRARFDSALGEGDVDGCVEIILELEQAVHDWSTDMLQSDDADKARRELKAMVVRLGDLARVGARDPRQALAPLVSALLDLREHARVNRDFQESDRIRDALKAGGVEVQDSPSGTRWDIG